MLLVSVMLAAGLVGCQRPPQPARVGSEARLANGTPRVVRTDSAADHKTAKQKGNVIISADESLAESRTLYAETRIVAYYFHRTIRCRACLAIEEQAREAIELAYSDQLKSGRMAWRAVDIEQAGNEHFEKDFDLTTSSLVIVEQDGDRVVRWQNLTGVWEWLHDEAGFQQYVWARIGAFLKASAAPVAGATW